MSTSSFAALGVDAALTAVLDRQHVEAPFPIQALTIPDGLAGRDLCGKAETGSGKTLAFLLPMVQRLSGKHRRAPRGLVLVPTRELALQVQAVLRPLAEATELVAHAFYGGAPTERHIEAARKGVDIIVATPGRLIDLLERGAVSLDHVEIAVIDEADRMADMGFLPQVEWILRRFPRPDDSTKRPQMMLFSATLDGDVDSVIRRYLHHPVRHEAEVDEDAPMAMTHLFLAVHQMDRARVAAAIASGVERTIMFVRTKRGADRLASQLDREGVRAAAIHGDLRQSRREQALRAFTKGKINALVATDVAARGIHVDDVDVVVQYDPPEDHKGYVHRSGRTARAGRSGTVVTFVLWNQEVEVERLKKRVGLDEPTTEVFSNDERLSDLTRFGAASAHAS